MIPGFTLQYPLLFAFLLLMMGAVYSDITRMEIPNGVSASVAVLYIVFAVFSPAAGTPMAAVLTAAGLFAGGAILFYLGAMGGGDVKLMAAIGLWSGPSLLAGFLVVVGLVGGLLAVIACTPLRFLLGHAAGGFSRRSGAMSLPRGGLPYGLAIAVGGVFVAVLRLAS